MMSDSPILTSEDITFFRSTGQWNNRHRQALLDSHEALRAALAAAEQKASRLHINLNNEMARQTLRTVDAEKALAAAKTNTVLLAEKLQDAHEARAAAEAERDHLREREAHWSSVLGVPDGGRYRNDWDSRIQAVVAERDQAIAERDERDKFWMDVLGGIKVLTELDDLPGIASEWRSENAQLNDRIDALEAQVRTLREALTAARDYIARETARWSGHGAALRRRLDAALREKNDGT